MFSAWRLVSVKVSSGCVGRRQANVAILRKLSAVPLCDMPLNRPSLASSWTASWAGVHAAGDLCAALASGAAEGLVSVRAGDGAHAVRDSSRPPSKAVPKRARGDGATRG